MVLTETALKENGYKQGECHLGHSPLVFYSPKS